MYKLYYTPGACSMAVHVALNECVQSVALEKVDMAAGQNRTPEYLKINPRGQVPVLVDGDQVIREGVAILLHILEKHSSPLMPKGGKERDLALEWLLFANATLHPAHSRIFFLLKNGAGEGALYKTAVEMLSKLWEEADNRLGAYPYLAGNTLTIADILLTVIANWTGRVPEIVLGENVKRLVRLVSARPAFQKALTAEGVTYTAA